MSKNKEKYLIISDLHIPDHDVKLLDLMYKFIEYYKPDNLFILGDFLNLTTLSTFEQDPNHKVTFSNEIETGKKILNKLVTLARKSRPGANVIYFGGNHEARVTRYLNKNAGELALLEKDGEPIISIQSLMGLKDLNVRWIAPGKMLKEHNVIFTHGKTVRGKSGYSAHSNMEKYGLSGFTGHTHRLAHIGVTKLNKPTFWIETGCMCNKNPTPAYDTYPNWQQGFAVAEYDIRFYPQIIPVIKNSFVFGDKMFRV